MPRAGRAPPARPSCPRRRARLGVNLLDHFVPSHAAPTTDAQRVKPLPPPSRGVKLQSSAAVTDTAAEAGVHVPMLVANRPDPGRARTSRSPCTAGPCDSAGRRRRAVLHLVLERPTAGGGRNRGATGKERGHVTLPGIRALAPSKRRARLRAGSVTYHDRPSRSHRLRATLAPGPGQCAIECAGSGAKCGAGPHPPSLGYLIRMHTPPSRSAAAAPRRSAAGRLEPRRWRPGPSAAAPFAPLQCRRRRRPRLSPTPAQTRALRRRRRRTAQSRRRTADKMATPPKNEPAAAPAPRGRA